MMKSPTLGVRPRAIRLVCTRVSIAVTVMHHLQRGVEGSNTEMKVTMKAILALVEVHPRENKTLTTLRLTMHLANMAAVVGHTVVGATVRAHPAVSIDPLTHLVHLQAQIRPSHLTHVIMVTSVVVLRVAMTMDLGLHSVQATLQSLQSTARAPRVADIAQEDNHQVMYPPLILMPREAVAIVHQRRMDRVETFPTNLHQVPVDLEGKIILHQWEIGTMVDHHLSLLQEHHQVDILLVPLMAGLLSHPAEEDSLQLVLRVVGMEVVDSRMLVMAVEEMQTLVLRRANSLSMVSPTLPWDMVPRVNVQVVHPQGVTEWYPPTLLALCLPRTIPSQDHSIDCVLVQLTACGNYLSFSLSSKHDTCLIPLLCI